MSRTYLSFLGTSDYSRCLYCTDGFELETRFVQQATIELCCRSWTASDRILIFATERAESVNWLNDGHLDRTTGEKLSRKGLGAILQEMNLPASHELVSIPTGKTEQELWEIFDLVLGSIKEGDELVLDITHAYRYIPMLALVVVNYAEVTKKAHVGKVLYGAFEASEAPSSSDTPRRVPIFDLTPFSQVQNWALAVDRFLVSGDARAVHELSQQSLQPVQREAKGADHVAGALGSVTKTLSQWSQALSTCRGKKITPLVSSLKRYLQNCAAHSSLRPFTPLLEMLEREFAPFGVDDIRDGILAARWCKDHSLIQQGFTILQETLVSYFVKLCGGNPERRLERTLANNAVTIFVKRLPESEWMEDCRKNKELTQEFLKVCEDHPDLCEVHRNLSDERNDLNHAGHNPHPRGAEHFTERLERYIKQVLAFIEDEGNIG